MHAIYSFLMDLPIKLGARHLKEQAISEFEAQYVPLCDENNWYQETALVTKTGRVIQLCGRGDWRGRDSWYGVIRKVEPARRWDWAWKFSLETIATEMELFEAPSLGIAPDPAGGRKKIQQLSFDDLLRAIQEWIPKTLSRAYAEFKPGKPDKDQFLTDYLRQKRAAVFEILSECSKPPFAWPRGPYEYRAFTLCGPEKGNAVMFVDIHT
jgi:hypothetical protein